MTEKTWEELKIMKSGTILHDEFKEGLRFIIMRGPCALCAYIGISTDHPLAGQNYDDLSVRAHGGLTFAGEGDGIRPEGFFWYGWDYSHAGDYAFYYDDPPLVEKFNHFEDKKWLVEDVKEDSWGTLYDFAKLMKLSESILKDGVKKKSRDENWRELLPIEKLLRRVRNDKS